MATGSPFGSDRNGMEAKPEIRIRENRILSGNFFSLFSLLRTPWDLRVTPRRFPYHLIWIRTGKSGFSGNFFFAFLASTASWDLRVTPRMDRNHLIRIRTGKSVFFFKNLNFLFFHLFKPKTPTIWVSMDSSGPN